MGYNSAALFPLSRLGPGVSQRHLDSYGFPRWFSVRSSVRPKFHKFICSGRLSCKAFLPRAPFVCHYYYNFTVLWLVGSVSAENVDGGASLFEVTLLCCCWFPRRAFSGVFHLMLSFGLIRVVLGLV